MNSEMEESMRRYVEETIGFDYGQYCRVIGQQRASEETDAVLSTTE